MPSRSGRCATSTLSCAPLAGALTPQSKYLPGTSSSDTPLDQGMSRLDHLPFQYKVYVQNIYGGYPRTIIHHGHARIVLALRYTHSYRFWKWLGPGSQVS